MKTTLFTALTGSISSDVIPVTYPIALDIDFSLESDRLLIYREYSDGEYRPWRQNGPVILDGQSYDNTIIVRPGNYKVVGNVAGTATCKYEALP